MWFCLKCCCIAWLLQPFVASGQQATVIHKFRSVQESTLLSTKAETHTSPLQLNLNERILNLSRYTNIDL